MTRLKKENSEYFYIQSKNKCDLKWSLNVITIGKSSEFLRISNLIEETYIIIYNAIFFLK